MKVNNKPLKFHTRFVTFFYVVCGLVTNVIGFNLNQCKRYNVCLLYYMHVRVSSRFIIGYSIERRVIYKSIFIIIKFIVLDFGFFIPNKTSLNYGHSKD